MLACAGERRESMYNEATTSPIVDEVIDPVLLAGRESFPASDPAFMARPFGRGIGQAANASMNKFSGGGFREQPGYQHYSCRVTMAESARLTPWRTSSGS